MQNLEYLTASRLFCERLFKMGVGPHAFFYHTVEDDHTMPEDKEGNPILKYEVCMLLNPKPKSGIYGTIPAWTKQEIDVMIGPGWPKPDVIESDKIGKFGDPKVYVVYMLNRMETFKNGADASAFVLLHLLENEVISISEINNRHNDFFKF